MFKASISPGAERELKRLDRAVKNRITSLTQPYRGGTFQGIESQSEGRAAARRKHGST